jgi:peptidyl-prolyl cis-trans isomerase-like 4
MVSTGDEFIGSQFFFTLGADISSLDGIHCVIGEVVEGHEVLRSLNEAIVDDKGRPYKDIRITHTVILDDPYPDPRGFRQPSRSPSPSAERMKNGRIGADEDIDDTQGKTQEEIEEMIAEKEAKARAMILEIVGDLPDADMAPPENVLFVCKLNPVTSDDDLQIIFSRFGKIKSCEVIRDKVSGDSLQYAFIEFENREACEAAYFKMDNVLIDDRRIHVDFSQSVSKVKWRGKGNYTIYDDSDQFKSDKRGKGRHFDNDRKFVQRRDRDQPRKRSNSPAYRRRSRSPRRYNDRRDERSRRVSPRRRSRSKSRNRNYRKSRSPQRRRDRSRSKSPRRHNKKSKKSRRSSSDSDDRRRRR